MMTIIHIIDKLEKLKVLLVCPMCLKNLFDDKKQIDFISNKQIINKEIALKEEIKNIDEYNCVCPHCKRFNIIYRNKLKKEVKNVTKEKLIDVDYKIIKKR